MISKESYSQLLPFLRFTDTYKVCIDDILIVYWKYSFFVGILMMTYHVFINNVVAEDVSVVLHITTSVLVHYN